MHAGARGIRLTYWLVRVLSVSQRGMTVEYFGYLWGM